MVDNVDEYYERIKNNSAKILSVPETKEWGMREMQVECPDGHIIKIRGWSVSGEGEVLALCLAPDWWLNRIRGSGPATRTIEEPTSFQRSGCQRPAHYY
ncbi:hypothetical protein [Agriterribacter humi]|uniref:hypothetical protein n=1 Tax=Agriterribacter humi TaxID=1104781 RepID=UPI003743253F